jgi:hypothetical protein
MKSSSSLMLEALDRLRLVGIVYERNLHHVSSRVNIRQRTPFVFKRKEKVIHKNE